MSDTSKDRLLGRVVFGYRFESLIHVGDVFRIYGAEQLSVGRKVALKVLEPAFAADSTTVDRFIEKARRAARWHHPNVAAIHDAHVSDDLVFYSMEFLEGGSLVDLLRRGRESIPKSACVRWRYELAEALEFAERHQVVHGDINPTHVLFSADGRVKLINLGFKGEDNGLVRRIAIASLPFLAPEVIEHGAAEARSDLYSLAWTLHYAETGNLPFANRSLQGIVEAKCRGVGLPPTFEGPGAELLVASASSDLGARPGSATRLREVLSKTPAPTRARPRSMSPPKPVGADRSKLLWSMAGVGLLFALWIISRSWNQPTVDPPLETRVARDGNETANEREIEKSDDPEPDRKIDELERAISSAAEKTREGLGRLRALEAAWRTSDPPSLAEAERQLSDLRRRFDQPEVERAAALVLKKIRRREFERERKSQLAAVDAAEFRRRIQLFDALEESYPEYKEILDEDRTKTRRRAAAVWAESLEKARGYEKSGRIARAIRLLDTVEPRLPAELKTQAENAIAEFLAKRDLLEDAADAFARAEDEIVTALRTAEWEVAGALLFELPEDLPPGIAKQRDELQQDLASCREADTLIDAALETASKRTTERLWIFADGEQLTGRLRSIRRGAGGLVELVIAEKTQRVNRDFFDLSADTMLSTLHAQGEKVDPKQLAIGLSALVFHRRGPSRALEVLEVSSAFEADELTERGGAMKLRAKRELGGRLKSLERDLDQLEDEPGDDAAWASLFASLQQTLSWVGEVPLSVAQADRVEEVFRGGLTGSLRSRGVEALVGGEVRIKDDEISLIYDFASLQDYSDFVPKNVGTTASSLRLSGKSLRLVGECRLFHGDPFKDGIAVRAIIDQYQESEPNVNVALWTKEDDRVSFNPPLDSAAVQTLEAVPTDFLAFCMGYSVEDENLVELSTLDGRQKSRFPCFAILGGQHGQQLHRAFAKRSSESIWFESSFRKMRGRQTFELVLEPSKFRWTVGRLSLHDRTRRADRELIRKRDPAGSISFFTNGSTVAFSQIRVDGTLNSWWVEEEIARRVQVEARSLRGRLVIFDPKEEASDDGDESESDPDAEPAGTPKAGSP